MEKAGASCQSVRFSVLKIPPSELADSWGKLGLYLQGGPGFECGPPKSHPLTEFFLGKGFQMLYVDQRGTGLSTPVDADTLTKWRTVEQQAAYLKLMRADNIGNPLPRESY
jgi:pimeloyl-ACP methyl ester carboxylesterase